MLKQYGQVVTILGSYGIGDDGKLYPGCCPDGIEGENHPAGTGPLYTDEGRIALGVTEEPEPERPDDTYQDVYGDPATGYTTSPKPLQVIASTKSAIANRQCDMLLALVKAGYPASEIESWGKQEAEARAWLADNSASTPLLDALAGARGITKVNLVDRVIARADAYVVVVGSVIGVRQAIEDAVAAALANEDAVQGRAALIAVDPLAGWPDVSPFWSAGTAPA